MARIRKLWLTVSRYTTALLQRARERFKADSFTIYTVDAVEVAKTYVFHPAAWTTLHLILFVALVAKLIQFLLN